MQFVGAKHSLEGHWSPYPSPLVSYRSCTQTYACNSEAHNSMHKSRKHVDICRILTLHAEVICAISEVSVQLFCRLWRLQPGNLFSRQS